MRVPRLTSALAGAVMVLGLGIAPVAAHPEQADDPNHDDDLVHHGSGGAVHDPSDPLEAHDAATENVDSSGPSAKVTKNLAVAGRGERLVADATTDVWAHGEHAYLGTFQDPCGTGDGFVAGVGEVDLINDVEAPGIAIFDIRNKTRPRYVGNLPSVEGSRSNDVKVASLNSGDVLAHSNEACEGGPGGIELYDVDDPTNAVHLSSIRIDEINPISDALFGGIADVGVHNIWLFSQGDRDYVSVVAETAFDNFQTFDITDPTVPERVSAWGAEEIFDPGVGDETADVGRVLAAALWLLDGSGNSANRFLHDITYNQAGTNAYLSNWDAGLVLLDMRDPSDPQLVSVAKNVEDGSLDGELNSHAAWPSENETIVVETEEDFSAWTDVVPPGNLTFQDLPDDDAPLPGVAVSTGAGDDFEANQTGNAGTVDADSLDVTSGSLAPASYPANELIGDHPKFADVGPVSGDIVFIGRACSDDPDNDDIPPGGDPILNAAAIADGGIAVVRRGDCSFREKNFAAAEAGADAVVIANDVDPSPWGGVRVWDYSDPADPVLASTFYTGCAAAATPIEGCDPFGTYTVHNVQVETRDDSTFAYISWYRDGMLVLDVTDPYAPVEVARFFDNSEEFLATNAGSPHDFWGVYKIPDEPWVYASDRNGGLYVLKEYGQGTERSPRAPGRP